MHLALPAVLLLGAVLMQPEAAGAQSFHGQWEQINSTGGSCHGCVIGIIHYGTVVTLTGNDGWWAVAETPAYGPARLAGGRAYRGNPGNGPAQRPSEVYLKLHGDQLRMAVVVVADGVERIVERSFSRRLPQAYAVP